MKNTINYFKTLLAISIWLLTQPGFAQQKVMLSGTLYYTGTNTPVPNTLPVAIESDDSTYMNTVYTANGMYADSVPANHLYFVSAYDSCKNYWLTDTIYITNQDGSLDLFICDSSGSQNCSAYFGYQGGGNIIQYYDYSWSNDSVTGWAWDFGDGSTSSLQNPTHTYANAGQYYVCLNITTNSCTNSYCQWITTGSNQNCDASFYYMNYDSSYSHYDSTLMNYFFYNYSSWNMNQWVWDFGDGTTSSDYAPYHVYTNAGAYIVCLTAIDTINNCSDILCDTIYVGNPSNFYGYISGAIYLDLNGNCVQDSGETGIPNVLVYLSPNWDYTYTDANGSYSFAALPGTYNIFQYQSYYNGYNSSSLTQVCPSNPDYHIVTIGAAGENKSGNDFYLKPKGTGQDVNVQMYCGGFVPGFDFGWASITYCNDGGAPVSGTVELIHDAALQLTNCLDSLGTNYCYYQPDSYDSINHKAVWNYTNLMPGQCDYIWLSFYTPVGTALGTPVSNSVTIFPVSGDATPNNNTDNCIDSVRGSYDPNDKQVSPKGVGTQGYISTTDTVLTYTINFQNTGTAQAYTVAVRDTLDVNVFDVNSITSVSAKHAFTTDLENNNILKFTFNNIMLPDSNTNEVESHGHATYTIKLKPGLPIGTQIRNSASIYFDFNDPVKTNSTLNTIGNFSGVKKTVVAKEMGANVHPNPFVGNTTFSYTLDKSANVSLEVLNVLGEQVSALLSNQSQYAGNHRVNLDGKELKLREGVYFIKLTVDGKVTTRKVLMVK